MGAADHHLDLLAVLGVRLEVHDELDHGDTREAAANGQGQRTRYGVRAKTDPTEARQPMKIAPKVERTSMAGPGKYAGPWSRAARGL